MSDSVPEVVDRTLKTDRPAVPDPGSALGTSSRRGQAGLRAYLVVLVLLLLVPALLLGAATTWELGTAYRRAEEAGLASTAEALATALDREVEIALTTLTALAASPSLAAGDLSEAYAQAAAVGRAFGGWVVLLDEDSRQILNTRVPLGTGLPRGGGDPYVGRAIATGRPVVSDLFVGATAGEPVISTFHPLPPEAAEASAGKRWVLLLAFSPTRLATLLARQRFEDRGGFAVLTDGNNRVVARSSEHARFLNRVSPEWYVQATNGRDYGLVRGGQSLSGSRSLLAFKRLEHAPSWTIAVITPFEPYEGQWRGPVGRYLAGCALLAGVAVLLAVLLARKVLKPLQNLAQDAEKLAQGDIPTSTTPEHIAEVEVLRQALWRSALALRAQGAAEGRAKAAEETAAALLEAARRRDLLVRELNHRVKNMLATVQSLASQTLRGSRSDAGRFVTDFNGRLRTLAQAHDLLTETNWEGADVDAVVRAALTPWRTGGRISTSGPEGVQLTPYEAQGLVLALHELSTNAAKYGALSGDSGRVEVSWWVLGKEGVERDQGLELLWRERGGPQVHPAKQTGFGSRLLERGLPHQFRGKATLLLLPEGVEYRLSALLQGKGNAFSGT